MRSFLTLLLLHCTFLAFAAPPANDDCSVAQVLTRQLGTSCTSTFAATTVDATASTQNAVFNANKDDDIWFSITLATGQTEANISASGISFTGAPVDLIFELWSSDCNTYQSYSHVAGATGDVFWTLTGLTAGTYKVRVYTNNTTSRANFNICFLAGPVNDDCASATVLTPVAGTPCTGSTYYNTMQATQSSQASGDATGRDDDVWFQFTTLPGNNAYTVYLTDINWSSPSGQPVIELWQNCGDAAHVNWYPFSSTASLNSLTPNTTYRIRVYSYGTSFRFSAFRICVAYVPAPPANDSYFSAATLPMNAGATCTSAITGGTTVGATEESGFAACGGATQHKEVWYKFVATKSTAFIQLNNITLASGTSSTLVMDAFEGSNTGPFKLCSNTGTLDFDASTSGATLTIGTTYYIRVYNQNASSSSNFDLCTRISTGLTFSNCANAVTVTASSNEFCSNAVHLTNVDANKGTLASGCTTDQWNSVWVKFVAPTSPDSYQFSVQNYKVVTGSNPSFYIAMYSGTCGSLTQINCNIGALQDLPGTLTPGQTYLVNILTFAASSQGTFDVCLRKKPAVPTNISCATAQTLTATSNASATYVNGTTLGVTMASAQDCFSSNSPNRIVWYKFVATASSHLVDVGDFVSFSANNNSTGIRLRQGTCAALTDLASPVCIFNVSNQNQAITGLTPGNTYYIEVMENSFNGGPQSFKIRVIGTAAPSNDESAGAINLVQSSVCTPSTYTLRFSTLSSATAPIGSFSEDVWFRFTAVASSATVTLSSRMAPNPQIALYASNATTLLNDGGFGVATFTGLTAGNVYYLRVLNAGVPTANPSEDFTICVTGTPASAIASDPTPGSCIQNDNTVVSTNSGTWLHFLKSGNIIASVLDVPGGGGMGAMTAKYFINTGSVRADGDGEEYLDRNIDISPASQPTNPVTVRLYFRRAEFERLVGANDGDGNDVYWLNDLKISKFSNLLCQSVIGATGEVLYGVAGYGTFGANAYYLDVTVPSFSSFYVMNTTGVLPVTCGGFNAERKTTSVRLAWKTLTEVNASHFEIQRSYNGTSFEKIGVVNATGMPSAYSYVDATAGDGMVYYRLLSVDKDGSGKFACSTVKLAPAGTKQPIFGNVYPNPATKELNVQVSRSYNGNVGIQVIDATGSVLQTRSTVLNAFDARITLNIGALAKGVYILRLQTVEGIETIRFTKQ